jgi:energy-coupling factor transporter ATP-binding protein EcfA2
VAMGRAIVRNPKVFLFDEPLSNLDAKLRVQMRTEIKRVHQKVKTTTVYVTHDQVEAMTLADRVVVMNHGRILVARRTAGRNGQGDVVGNAHAHAGAILFKLARDKIHRRRAYETGDEPCARLMIELLRRSDLLGICWKTGHPWIAAGAHHRTATQWPQRWIRLRGDPGRRRAAWHGDDGLLYREWHRNLRPRRA